MNAKPRNTNLKLVQITRANTAVEVLAIPKTARLTIYAGRVGKPGPRSQYEFGSTLAAGGQLRIYLGNQLIGFFPDILEMHVISDVSCVPLSLPEPKSATPGTYEELERSESSPFQGKMAQHASNYGMGVSSQAKKGTV